LVCLVPQTAADLLYLPTVGRELAQADLESKAKPGTAARLLQELGVEIPAESDPRDLSEGQRLALVLAIQLTARPAVVLLDEPTRGLDYATKEHLNRIIQQLRSAGLAVAISTHDVEFAAAVSTRMVLMADADIIADDDTRTLCASSVAFAPQMTKVFAPEPVLTVAEVARGLRDAR
ncbi:MAG: AAA family ATPase, partial [Propionibacteriaceae bacterium]|nr:AAA family ATPase [Propionibacteriaceae bacterium]